MTATTNIATDTDIAYAVGTAANAWGDTDYWTDETGNVIGLDRVSLSVEPGEVFSGFNDGHSR